MNIALFRLGFLSKTIQRIGEWDGRWWSEEWDGRWWSEEWDGRWWSEEWDGRWGVRIE
jgi:hypothetical protein